MCIAYPVGDVEVTNDGFWEDYFEACFSLEISNFISKRWTVVIKDDF